MNDFIYGNNLVEFVGNSTLPTKTRSEYDRVKEYLDLYHPGLVCVLYGHKNSGKTTMLLQGMLDIGYDKILSEAAYIDIGHDNFDIEYLIELIDKYYNNDIRYFFINDIDKVRNFASGASTLSDIYAGRTCRFVVTADNSYIVDIALGRSLLGRNVAINLNSTTLSDYMKMRSESNIVKYICNSLTRVANSSAKTNQAFLQRKILDQVHEALCNYPGYGRINSAALLNEITSEYNNPIMAILKNRAFEYVRSIISRVDEEDVIKRMLSDEFMEYYTDKYKISTVDTPAFIEAYYIIELYKIATCHCSIYAYPIRNILDRTVFTHQPLLFIMSMSILDEMLNNEIFSNDKNANYIRKILKQEIIKSLIEAKYIQDYTPANPRKRTIFPLSSFSKSLYGWISTANREASATVISLENNRDNNITGYIHVEIDKIMTRIRHKLIKPLEIIYPGEDYSDTIMWKGLYSIGKR